MTEENNAENKSVQSDIESLLNGIINDSGINAREEIKKSFDAVADNAMIMYTSFKEKGFSDQVSTEIMKMYTELFLEASMSPLKLSERGIR